MLCRKYQLAIEKERDDFGTVQDAGLLRHLENCSGCKRFYQTLVHMENRLRNTPGLDVTEEQVNRLREAVTRRIAAAAPIQSQVSPLPPAASYRLCYGLTAAAAMLMVSLMGIFYVHNYRSGLQPDPAAQFVTGTSILQTQLSRVARVPEQSLQAEMQKLTGHARSAVTFLADCIPASPAAGETQDDRQ